jgi:hypothetical protein
MAKNKKIEVKGTEITIYKGVVDDYISLTDIARYKDSSNTDDIIKTGFETEIQLNYLVFGSRCIIQILNPSNSTGLENKPG